MMIKRSYVLTKEMIDYGSADTCRTVPPMKTLYESPNIDSVCEIAANLVFAYIMQDEVEIDEDKVEQIKKAGDTELIADATAKYASFVCEYNPNFSKEDFTRLCNGTLALYEDYFKSRMESFSFDADLWKSGFKGALFIR